MGDAYGYVKCIWAILNGPNNQPIIVALVLGWFSLILSQIGTFFTYRARLKDKDGEINRLVEERNKLQDYLLRNKGMQRLTTKPVLQKKKEVK